jgi:hypothetical protein
MKRRAENCGRRFGTYYGSGFADRHQEFLPTTQPFVEKDLFNAAGFQ